MRNVRLATALAFLIPALCAVASPAAAELPEWMIRPFGFAQMWYAYDGNKNQASQDQLRVQRVRLGGMGQASPTLRYLFLSEWADANPSGTRGDLSLLDAHVTYAAHPLLNIRAGQDWYMFTLEGSWTLFEMPFIMRSEVVDRIWLPMGRVGNFAYDRGLYVFGAHKEGPVPFKYYLSATGGAGINTADTNKMKDFVGRAVATPLPGLDLGMSAFHGYSRVNSNALALAGSTIDLQEYVLGTEAHYSYKNRVRVFGEYLWGRYHGSVLHGITPVRPKGFYLAAALSPLKRVELRGRYAYYDPNTLTGSTVARTWTIGATYTINLYSRFKLDYLIRRAGSDYPGASGQADPDNFLAAQLTVLFFPKKALKKFVKPLGAEEAR